MADTKPAKPTPSAVKDAQNMWDSFMHISKISILATIFVLMALYIGLVAF